MIESMEKEVGGLLFNNPKQLKSALWNYVNRHNSGLKFRLTAVLTLGYWEENKHWSLARDFFTELRSETK